MLYKLSFVNWIQIALAMVEQLLMVFFVLGIVGDGLVSGFGWGQQIGVHRFFQIFAFQVDFQYLIRKHCLVKTNYSLFMLRMTNFFSDERIEVHQFSLLISEDMLGIKRLLREILNEFGHMFTITNSGFKGFVGVEVDGMHAIIVLVIESGFVNLALQQEVLDTIYNFRVRFLIIDISHGCSRICIQEVADIQSAHRVHVGEVAVQQTMLGIELLCARYYEIRAHQSGNSYGIILIDHKWLPLDTKGVGQRVHRFLVEAEQLAVLEKCDEGVINLDNVIEIEEFMHFGGVIQVLLIRNCRISPTN